MTAITCENANSVESAVRFLAGVCDGAVTQDGRGFNGVDSVFGKSLAGQSHWSVLQKKAALKMLKKYSGQLKSAGFNTEEIFSSEIIPEVAPIIENQPVRNQEVERVIIREALLNSAGKIEIRFTFEWNVLDSVKTIPGRKFDPVTKHWSAPISIDAVEVLKKHNFKIAKEIIEQIGVPEEKVEELSEIEISGLKRTLFPFQKKGVAFIESRKGRALIADEMGLGKTIQAIAWTALHPELKPVIIVCPASVKLNWAREIRETISGANNIQVINGGDTSQELYGDYIIINYDVLGNKYNGRKEITRTGWVDFLIELNPKIMIFDEAHYIKSGTALRTKGTRKLAKKIPHVIALSGTPIVNRPVEGFNIAQIVNKNVFPDFWKFAHTYCGAKHNGFGWDFTGATKTEELHEKLSSTFMVRRKKSEVLTDLPDKLYSFIPLELNNEIEYKKAENDFIAYLKGTKGEKAAEKAKQAEHLAKIETLKQLASSGKIKQAVSWIKDFFETNGDKLVVFATHKKIIDALMEEFKEISVKIDGSVSSTDREYAVQAFQNDKSIRLFVGNIQAAGVGITLTAASAVAFIELPWTPGDLVQAEDRCHRIGQNNNVNIYYLLANGTIEEKIAALLDEKKKVLSQVLDGKEVEESSLLSELIKNYTEE